MSTASRESGVHANCQRYIGQDDDVETQERIEELNEKIDVNVVRKDKATEKMVYLNKKQEGIRTCFTGLVFLLTGSTEKLTAQELIDTSFIELDNILAKIGDRQIDILLDEMDEVGFKTSGLESTEDTFKEAEELRKKKRDEGEKLN